MRNVILLIVGLVIVGGLLFTQSPRSESNSLDDATSSQLVTTAPDRHEPEIVLAPVEIIQGDPVEVTLRNVKLEEIASLTFNKENLSFFMNDGLPTAFIGIDLRMATGTYPVILKLKDGEELRTQIVVHKKMAPQETFGIPEKLGGNTPQAVEALGNSLIQEGQIINSIPTENRKLWSGKFRFPIDPPVEITDDYGYTRITGQTTFSHKGTDFRAEIGTPVYAINSGVVRFTKYMRNYGNTVVVDHGYGLESIYMHLSQTLVIEGQSVKKGDLLGKSGDTGYVLGPHLHLSLKINKISIDPMKFFELMGE